MALTNNVIRRAAPLAARSIVNQRYYHKQSCSDAPPTNGGGSPSQKLFSRSIRYFTKAKTEDNEHSLLNVLDKKIKCQVDSQGHYLKNDDIPENFPFTIEDEPMEKYVYINREYEGERIIARVEMPSHTGEDDGGERIYLKFEMAVLKLAVPRLDISVSAYADKISIDEVFINDSEYIYLNYDNTVYNGPDYRQNLQNAFNKFLDIRGFNASNLSFLHEYMMNKNCRQYIGWLKHVKMIVQD